MLADDREKLGHFIRHHRPSSTAMHLILAILVAVTGSFLLVAVFQCLYLGLLGVHIHEVRIFVGPTILSIPVGKTKIRIGLIPIGCTLNHERDTLRRKPLLARWFFYLMGAPVCLGLAFLLLGPAGAWDQFTVAFREIPQGALSPIAKAAPYLSKWPSLARVTPILAMGTIAAKIAAFYLLPLGGTAITHIAADLGETRNSAFFQKLASLNAMLSIAIAGLWIFALFHRLFLA